MSAYAKALVPLVTGVVVGVVLILSGDKGTGEAVLLAAVGASGLSFTVPNKSRPRARRR